MLEVAASPATLTSDPCRDTHAQEPEISPINFGPRPYINAAFLNSHSWSVYYNPGHKRIATYLKLRPRRYMATPTSVPRRTAQAQATCVLSESSLATGYPGTYHKA